MTEYEETVALANRLLDEPNEDPDDDLRTLSRQFLRQVEKVSALEKNLTAIAKVCALAGIGTHGQTVLCRVKDLHATLGQQIERGDRAEAELRRQRQGGQAC